MSMRRHMANSGSAWGIQRSDVNRGAGRLQCDSPRNRRPVRRVWTTLHTVWHSES